MNIAPFRHYVRTKRRKLGIRLFKFRNPKYRNELWRIQNRHYRIFTRKMLREIAQGLSVSYERLSRYYINNYDTAA